MRFFVDNFIFWSRISSGKKFSTNSPISLFSSSKRFPKIDEFSSETSRFAMIMCRSSQTTQRVHLTRDQEKHISKGSCLPFGQSANTLQPSCGTITKSIFILWHLIGSLFVLCLHQTLLNCAFLLDDFRQPCQ